MKNKIIFFVAALTNFLLPNYHVEPKSFLHNKRILFFWTFFSLSTDDIFVFKFNVFLDFKNGFVIFFMIPYLSLRFCLPWPNELGNWLYDITTYQTEFEKADEISKKDFIKKVKSDVMKKFPNANLVVVNKTEKNNRENINNSEKTGNYGC